MFNGNNSTTLTNCTFSRNTASNGYGGGIYQNLDSYLTVTNCVLWGDTPNEIFGFFDDIAITFSDVEFSGGWPGTGNINTDPLFVDPDNDDYHLSPGSPCIDAADNTAVQKGIDTDLDGNPRFVDDPDTKDTGFGDPPIADMGAYEFQALNCPWDLDGNGTVGATDLLSLLVTWGVCAPCIDCPADFDGNCTVGATDLLALLVNWGPCP